MIPKTKQTQAIYIPPALRQVNSDVKEKNSRKKSDHVKAVEKDEIDEIDDKLNKLTILSEQPQNQKFVKILTNTNTTTQEPKLNYDNYRHILELYNFPKDMEASFLESELNGFEDSGFYLKWVDDSHCLAVFSSNAEADRALSQISGLFVKVRTMDSASLPSKWKLARSPGDWAMPYKKRPPTNSLTAQRFIVNHLGIRNLKKSEEQIKKENEFKKALHEARAKAEEIRKAQKAIWEDDW